MIEAILGFYDLSLKNLDKLSIDKLIELPVTEKIGRFKYVDKEQAYKEFEAIQEDMRKEISELAQKGDV